MLKVVFILCISLVGTDLFSQNTPSTIFTKNKPFLCLSFSPQNSSEHKYSMLTQLSKTKKPMFCRLEDNLCKRFNIWILFRAGSDADYQKLIALPKYHFAGR